MRKTLCVALALLLTGCMMPTTGKYEAVLKSWESGNINDLISKWGPPSSTYEMPDGRKLFTWNFDGGVVATPTYGGGAYAVRRTCTTTFTVEPSGRVASWRYQGNACTAN